MKRVQDGNTGAPGGAGWLSRSGDEPPLRRARVDGPAPMPPQEEAMPAGRIRQAGADALVPRAYTTPLRQGLANESSHRANVTNPRVEEMIQELYDDMIQELLAQPGEIEFVTPPRASGAPATLSTQAEPTAGTRPDRPAAARLLQTEPRSVEVAIAAMRRHGLPRDVAGAMVGLPAGTLAAVVDAHGRWLDDNAQLKALTGLSPSQIQDFAQMLQRMQANLPQQFRSFERTSASTAGSAAARMLQENEVDAMIAELTAPPGEHDVVAWAWRTIASASQVQMNRVQDGNTGAADGAGRPSRSGAEPPLRRTRGDGPTPTPRQENAMPAERIRQATVDTLVPRADMFPARLGLTDTPDHRTQAVDPHVDDMVRELLAQPGEIEFVTPPRPQTPPLDRSAAAQLLQAAPRDIEAAIAVMRRDGLPRETAGSMVGLPAGALAAVVDAQGRWLDERAQSDAAAGLPPSRIQDFARRLQQMRANLGQPPRPPGRASAPAAGTAPARMRQENEVDAMIAELTAPPGGHDVVASPVPVPAPTEKPKSRMTPAQAAAVKSLARAVRLRIPREPGEISNAAWARRIHATDPQVQALPYRQRIAVLMKATGATELRSEPTLRDVEPKMAQIVQHLRTLIPRQANEGPTAWARRIHQADERVRALPFQERLATLAAVTGARESTLASQPMLRDIDPDVKLLAEAIRARVPQQNGELMKEPLLHWVMRIYKAEPILQTMPYKERIELLAAITQAREADLRAAPALRDTNTHVARMARDVRQRVPRNRGEAASWWARRIYKNDTQVRALPYAERINLLSVVTEVRENTLRAMPVLRGENMTAEQMEMARDIRLRIPRNLGESRSAWALRIHDANTQVQVLPYNARIAVLSVITGRPDNNLRRLPALRVTPAATSTRAADSREARP